MEEPVSQRPVVQVHPAEAPTARPAAASSPGAAQRPCCCRPAAQVQARVREQAPAAVPRQPSGPAALAREPTERLQVAASSPAAARRPCCYRHVAQGPAQEQAPEAAPVAVQPRLSAPEGPARAAKPAERLWAVASPAVARRHGSDRCAEVPTAGMSAVQPKRQPPVVLPEVAVGLQQSLTAAARAVFLPWQAVAILLVARRPCWRQRAVAVPPVQASSWRPGSRLAATTGRLPAARSPEGSNPAAAGKLCWGR